MADPRELTVIRGDLLSLVDEAYAAGVAKANAASAARIAELEDVADEFAAHMATAHAPVEEPETPEEPEPPVVVPAKTLYGACPLNTPAGAVSVLSKYGVGASVRLFFSGGFGSVTRPSNVSKMHVSWKPAIGSTISDSQVITACGNLRDGDLVEVWHESDVKYRKGQNLAGMLALKNAFHDTVALLRSAGRIPQVLTVNTWAGWSVDSTSSVNPANLHCRADLLGIDMDGLPANENFYQFATRQMGSKFVAAYKAGGYKGWTIGEFCMPSVPSDPAGTRRTTWFRSEVDKISKGVPTAGIPAPHMIAWFDTAGIIGNTEKLLTTTEISAWKALVAQNDG